METLTTEAISDMIPSILFYLTVSTIGAFSKDMYETMVGKSTKIHIGEIIVGGLVATFLCIGLSDTIFKNFSFNSMILIAFILGGLGFEIFGNLTSIDKIRNFMAIVNEIRSATPPPVEPTNISENENSGEVVNELDRPPEVKANGSPPVRVEERDNEIKIIITTDNRVLVEDQQNNPEDNI